MHDDISAHRQRLIDEAVARARVTWERTHGDDVDLSEESIEQALRECSRLSLDPDGLTLSLPLADQLSELEKSLQNVRTKGYFPTSRAIDFDPSDDADRPFKDNATFEKMAMRDPELRRLKFANKHRQLSLQIAACESEALDRLLNEEIGRRRAMAEGWRYSLPKAALPFYAALHASRLGRNELRTNTRFFGDFLDFLAARTPHVSRSDLELAAQKTEEQFALELQIDRERTAVSQDVDRLNAATKVELARLDEEAATSSEREAELADRIQHLRVLIDMGGGLDGAGNVVLPSDQLAALRLPGLVPEVQLADDEPQLLEDSPEAAQARLGRSFFLAKTTRENHMAGYIFRGLSDPENFVPARVPCGFEYDGELELQAELFDRVEIPAGCNSILREDDYSPVLGRGHELMLPSFGLAQDYGNALGWGEQDIRQIRPFGAIWDTSRSYPLANVSKLIEAIRGVVILRMKELVSRQASHRLADPIVFEEAVEDLTRYWLFVLYGRHAMETFEEALGACYFHGVHGPDFVIEDGLPKFLPAHFVITNTRRYLLEPVRDDAWLEKNGLAAGLRRRIRPFNG